MAERTLFLIKPDAVERRLAGEILGRLEQPWTRDPRREAPDRRPRARRDALRRASREAVLRRARRLHHVGADARARPRGRVGDPRRADDDGRHESGRRRAGNDPRRPGARDAEQSRPRLRLARVRRARDRALVPRPWLRTSRTRSRGTPRPGTAGRPSTPSRAAATGQSNEPSFGIWDFPEAEIGFLGDVEGKDVVELGCGTAYISLVGRPARRPARRRRSVGRPARDRARPAGRVRARVSPGSGGRGERPASGRGVRPRAVRVRGEPLGRSRALAVRGGAAPAPRAGAWSSCGRRRSSSSASRSTEASPRARSSSGRTSAGSAGSSGPTTTASSTSPRTAI